MIKKPTIYLCETELLENRKHISSKPIIGLSFDWRDMVNEKGEKQTVYAEHRINDYMNAISMAGGEPYVLSYEDHMDSVGPLLDGLVLCGGRDINPKYYGEEINGSVVVDNDDRFEFNKEVMDNIAVDLPVFGICWGMQFLNILSGGTLVQNIPDKILHANVARIIKYEPGSWFFDVTKGENKVKCLHHQAIKDLGKGYKVVGWDDASHMPHAFESTVKDQFRIGVQYHPEIRDIFEPECDENKKNQMIFESFIRKSAEFKKKKNGQVGV